MTKTAEKAPELFETKATDLKGDAAVNPITVKPKAEKKPKSQAVAKVEPAAPPAAAVPANFLQLLYQMAIDPRVDVEKMRAGLDMQERIEGSEARKAFTRAFNALQFDLPTIDKDGFIDHGEGLSKGGNKKLKARYSTYPNLMGVCRPLLKKHGFTFNNTVEPSADGARINVVGYLTHVDGHGMRSNFPLGADAGPGRSNAQAWGSSSSYGKRYNLILLLDIVSEAPIDRDDDGKKAKVTEGSGDFPGDNITTGIVLVDQAQQDKLREAIDDCGVGSAKFCSHYSIQKIGDLPAARYADAITACKNFKDKKAANG